MTSRNELRTQIVNVIIAQGMLDQHSSIGFSSNDHIYLRLRDQVFRIDVEEVDQISQADDPMHQAALFMSTLEQLTEGGR
ncbi:hypothetical protein [Galbibacter sp. BG1]